MKKFTSLLISCSLVLAGIAFAQQPEESASPAKGKKPHAAEKTHGAEAKPGATAPRPETAPGKQHGAMNAPPGAKGHEMTPKPGRPGGAAEPKVSGEAAASPMPGGKHPAAEHKKGMKPAAANAEMKPPAANAKASPETAGATTAKPPTATTSAATSGAGAKKVEPQKVQQVKAQATQIKQQHATFKAQPKPEQVPTVTFQQNYRIQNSEQWSGPQYEVFRSYHPEWHDQGWYRSHFTRVELIGGGWYFWNNGYWYPAWGYDPAAQYYAFDAPIYVGHRAEPPDRVIADVQAELQQMGYYRGEVDGLLGPLTREALTAYQADQGLTQTAMIDAPTLDSLGLS